MLLAIDTCGNPGGVAVGSIPETEQPTTQNPGWAHSVLFRELSGRTFSERLLGTVSELVAEAGISVSQLRAIVVVHGPGSFTGIRIGVSAAKGLAEGLGIPAIAISRLELLAGKSVEGDAVAVLDAGRGEFFAGVYRRNASSKKSLCEIEAMMTREELSELLEEAGLPMVVCEARIYEALKDLRPFMVSTPTAIDALGKGVERFQARIFNDVVELDANYLRRSDLEMLARIANHAALRTSGASSQ